MRKTWIGVGILLAGAAKPAAGQDIVDMALALATWRFGSNAAANYSGKISWTWSSGDSKESAEVNVIGGKAFCSVTYQDSEGTRSARGPGLLEIDLGLPYDEDTPPAQRKGKQYVLRIACPDATYTPSREARWSHSQDTYKHPGGDVGAIDPQTRQFRVPRVLRGAWTAPTEDGGETTRVTWDLCVGCTPPPQP
jgi:hypothetical protein